MTDGPRFSIAEITTPDLSFGEDLDLYSEVGSDGIGILPSLKLTDPTRDLERFRASGLPASVCSLRMAQVLPNRANPEPAEPDERIARICRSLDEVAPFAPPCCVTGPGPYGEYEPERAREIAVDGLKRVARHAAELGLSIAIEPINRSIAADVSFVTDLPGAAALCEEIDEPNAGILFDVWHQWDAPDLAAEIGRNIDRIFGVQVADRREPTRSWCDRVLPGEGVADVGTVFGYLRSAGYHGWVDLEVMSDDGRFGNAYADSLWRREPRELARDGLQRMRELWGA